MNLYLTFNSSTLDYQTIARNSRNQTFVWQTTYMGVANTNQPKIISLRLKSDLNYQLAVL